MSLKEVARLAKNNGMGAVTIGELLRNEGGRTDDREGAVDTRTVDARQRYDHALMRELVDTGEWMGAAQLRRACGGTPLQVRKALARLVNRSDVEWKGKARATVYRAVGGRRRKGAKPKQ